MKLKKNIAVSETGFLFDPNTGESYNLNKTGQFIVKLLAEKMSEEQVMNAVMEKYEIEPIAYQRYMDDFSVMLKQFGIIEPIDD